MRLLLSDPLAPREDWEGLLNGSELDISQGLLIRCVYLLRFICILAGNINE